MTMRRIVALLMFTACSDGQPRTAGPQDAAAAAGNSPSSAGGEAREPAPASSSADDAGSPGGDGAEPGAAADVEASAAKGPGAADPADADAPVGPTLPNGVVITPCGAPPPGMACVEGGAFIRGSDDGPDNERPAETIWLQTFYMDVHEVRFAEYKACQKSKACPRAGPLYNDFNNPEQPITGPSWYDAVKYCEVQGKHLPTEAQWEKAARGPDGARHPWGDEPATCERAVIKDSRGRSCGVDKRREHPKKGKPFKVGTRPAGVYGLYDMSGNAWEWVADWASEGWAECGEDCRGVDPLGPCGGTEPCKGHTEKVVRGGSWYWVAKYATSTRRRFHVPGNDPFHHFGFRCAASVDEAAAFAGD